MPAYWDANVELDQILASPPSNHAAPWTIQGRNTRGAIFTNAWSKRDWRNVPGPFYTTETDTCGGGRALAANLILVNDDWSEFVYRQPADTNEVIQLIDAAYDDPFQAYGDDGDDHWTLEEVRLWWADRNRLLEWITSAIEQMQAERGTEGETASLREYAADIDGPLEDRLRRYVFWLDNGRTGQSEERLPPL